MCCFIGSYLDAEAKEEDGSFGGVDPCDFPGIGTSSA
jgi:hypothetical protein